MRTSSIARPGVSIRRGADRHQTRIDWLHGRHSFDTGIDPLGADTHHGVLVVSNHDTIAPRHRRTSCQLAATRTPLRKLLRAVSRSILRRNHHPTEYQARHKTPEQPPNQEAANHRHPRKKSR
jgi:hypothetical protein